MTVTRHIKNSIDQLLGKYPVIALTGPRQSGKTTFLKSAFPDYQYLNMEKPDLRAYFDSDPNSFLEQYNSKIIFDEAQRVPDLFSYIQAIVDESGIMGQFILSGSQNFQLLEKITQSLAGRVALFKLFPFDTSELAEANLLDDNYAVNACTGFYPSIYSRNISPKTFYSNYMQTYVERDITTVVNVRDMTQFRNFVKLCAARAGQLLNLNSLAKDAGISQPTARAWISLLETSYIIFVLQPYFTNPNKRIIKSPKLYFYDTGFLCNLLRINSPEELQLHRFKGMVFENMIVSEFVKRGYHLNLMQEYWFWRSHTGHEIDFIWQETDKLNLVEIKASATISNDMFKGLNYFDEMFHDEVGSKTLIYAGLENQHRSPAEILSWRDQDKLIQ